MSGQSSLDCWNIIHLECPNFLWEFSGKVIVNKFQPQFINNDEDDDDVGVLILQKYFDPFLGNPSNLTSPLFPGL